MKFDITKHMYVPKHSIMKEEDVKELLEKFNISKRQLPRISKKDPVVLNLNAKVGDVIKILRNSKTALKSEYYRVIVSE